MHTLSKALWFLIDTVSTMYIMILLLRLMMQMVRANAYNPLCQFVLRLTTPVIRPVQNWVPGYHGIDLAILLVAWVITVCKLCIYALLDPVYSISLTSLLVWSFADLLQNLANLMFYLVLARVILSWLHNPQLEPMLAVVYSLTEPLLRRVRRWVPLVSGFDLSPLVVLLGLTMIVMFVVSPIMTFAITNLHF